VASSLDGKDQVLWSQACHVDMIMMDLEVEDEYYLFFADFSGSYKRKCVYLKTCLEVLVRILHPLLLSVGNVPCGLLTFA
jgi:hypothetical protein